MLKPKDVTFQGNAFFVFNVEKAIFAGSCWCMYNGLESC